MQAAESYLGMFLKTCVGCTEPRPPLCPSRLELGGCYGILHSMGMLLQGYAGSCTVAEEHLIGGVQPYALVKVLHRSFMPASC